MSKSPQTRRSFLETLSIAGVAAVYATYPVTAKTNETMPQIQKAIFVCSVCGHVEFGTAPDACPVCHAGKENFGQKDSLFKESEEKFGSAGDKHLPVITATKKSKLVTEKPSVSVGTKIGSVIHPMEKGHHIRFIDFYIDDVYVSRLLLSLNNHPAAGCEIRKSGEKVRIVITCNLHGYWQNEAVIM